MRVSPNGRHYFFTPSKDDAFEACNIIAKFYRVNQGLRKEDIRASVVKMHDCGFYIGNPTHQNDFQMLWERYGKPQPPST